MVLPTAATLNYDVVPYAASEADLELDIAPSQVAIDPGYLMFFRATITSDGTSNVGGDARRSAVLSLTQGPTYLTVFNKPLDLGGERIGYQATIESTNANDVAATGTGVRTVVIAYKDTAGTPQTETVSMNGKTPVKTMALNINEITGITNNTTGSSDINLGVLIVRRLNTTNIVASVLEGFFVDIPYTQSAEWPRPWVNMLTNPLEKQVGSLVTRAPIIT
jgi:hypothetical protein